MRSSRDQYKPNLFQESVAPAVYTDNWREDRSTEKYKIILICCIIRTRIVILLIVNWLIDRNFVNR